MDLVSLLASTGLLTAILAQFVRAVRSLGRLEARLSAVETHVAGIERLLADVSVNAKREAVKEASAAARSIVQARCAGVERRLVVIEQELNRG